MTQYSQSNVCGLKKHEMVRTDQDDYVTSSVFKVRQCWMENML